MIGNNLSAMAVLVSGRYADLRADANKRRTAERVWATRRRTRRRTTRGPEPQWTPALRPCTNEVSS